ncbi:endonuclease [Flaviramulus sp. BrNp1-15]|uniref:endonuclease n=1 Tax=Flaviramulus sp. BrNp1-15 TaxID=2916754 RepID=UPI001EE93D61|nr:endonuclease [Flaviramulus sp. BrNp1-15]ULC58387.1 endonuclease [Flaviramulus sp. BrNp1-15]
MKIKKLLFCFTLFLIPFLGISQIPSYYNDVNLNQTGQSLQDELATKIISTHATFLSYTPGVWDALKQTDLDPNDNSKVLLIYGYNDNDGDPKSDRTRGVNMNGGNVGDWNREHVYAKSLGNPNLGTSGPGADAHHLRPSDTQWNSTRSNRKFTDGSGNAGIVGSFWYPGDEWKGDVARMMMYMYLRYGSQCLPVNVGEGNPVSGDANMIDLFLQWNVEDPVSAFEDQRNPILENIQGNRNPFIDNPAFATQIWGGPQAEDRFGSAPSDTDAPSVPANLVASNILETTIDLSWAASTDNVGVIAYDIYESGSYFTTVSSTSYQATGLTASTSYSFVVYARDAAGNVSGASNTVTETTNAPSGDTEAPTAPTSLSASNITQTTVNLSWIASTDNVGVVAYDVFVDGILNQSSANTSITVSGLVSNTSYAFTVYAKDAAGNTSGASNTVNATTLESTGGGTTSELLISEYVEGSSNNKAIEIANFTGASVDLSSYTLKRNVNGGSTWGAAYNLSGVIANQSVYVVANNSATTAIINVADATTTADALIFNGNDPVGLFKNDMLIDVVGVFNNGTANFAANTTLRRKSSVSNPSTTYTVSEWDSYATDTFDGLGSHTIDGGGSVSDTEAPTAPINVALSNITETTIGVTWTASTDNVGVTGYSVYVDGILNQSTANTNAIVTGLTVNTSYSITVYATDAAGNVSVSSASVNGTTLDLTAPSTPVNLSATNITQTTVDLSWTASTDNVGVVAYDVFVDGILNQSSVNTSITVSGLVSNTSYAFTVYAKDAAGNTSGASTTVNATTLENTGGGTTSELLISEYVEGSSNNKAIEIANFTGASVNLSGYSLKRNVNGGSTWGAAYNLSGVIANQSVFVVANTSATTTITNIANVTTTADALIFNGNDPVGLFKNDVLIDVVGIFNNGTANFAADTTLRRKSSVSNPSTTYSVSEWDSYATDTFDGLGSHSVEGTTGPEVLHEAYFESGWDNWSDGGSDCARYSGSRSFEGNYSIRLRDDSSSSIMTSETFDLTGYNSVDFEFNFYAYSMETGEDFFVKYYNGSSWVDIANYVSGTDFNNNNFYAASITLDSASYNFNSNSQFRIQCDASSNSDYIYIDQITIIGNGGVFAKSGSSKTNKDHNSLNYISFKDTSSEGLLDEFSVYPNPVSGSILNIHADSDFVNYRIVNLLGQSVKSGVLNNEIITVDSLKSGMYVIELSDGEEKVAKKFVKQ